MQYNENPEDYKNSVKQLTSLRSVSCVKINITQSNLDSLKKYYCQLHFFRNRFKVLDSPLMKKGPFDFPWCDEEEDLFMAPSTYDNLDNEMGFVLYNIGVLHSLLGSL